MTPAIEHDTQADRAARSTANPGADRATSRGADRTGNPSLVRAILAHALAIGVAADVLLRGGFTGPGFALWLALLALAALSLAQADRRSPSREAAAWLATAVGFGAAMAWREASYLQALDFLTALFALGMAAIALGDTRSALFARRMRDSVWAGAAVIGSIAVGAVALVLRAGATPPSRPRAAAAGLRPAVRATLIALPLVLVFGLLLRDADPVFASFVVLPDIDVATIVSHLFLTGFFAWVTAGWARGALITDLAPGRAPDRLPFSLGRLDVTVAMGALNALFALYLATQIGWLFGGAQFLQSRTGLTVAEYARGGFFQMVWVALLVIPVLLVTRAALREGDALERRHTALALPLLILLGAMILSAVLRMRLYVQYFGLTLDRLYPLVFMGWLTAVLVWLGLTVLRGSGQRFAPGAVLAGLATVTALNVAVPDLIVAHVNLTRAEGGATLDIEHLAGLSGETMPLVVPAILSSPSTARPADAAALAATDEARCRAATRVLRSWGPTSQRVQRRAEDSASWRSWNRGEAVAQSAVRAQAPALRDVMHGRCAPSARR